MKFLILFLLTMSTFSQVIDNSNQILNQLKKVTIGGRIQGMLQNDSDSQSQDIYLRRLRLNLEYNFNSDNKIVYDIRNDRANFEDSGDREFAIGDAYWQINMNKSWINNIRLFRAKVDVSYSQTSSSKDLFNPNRAIISDYASNFIISGRRAANIQANGNIDKLAYQVVISDGLSSDDLESIGGSSTVSSIEKQKLTYGIKFRYYFKGDANVNRVQDTFYGESDSLSIGVGHFRNDRISVVHSGLGEKLNLNRALTNLDFSYSINSLRILGEYFQFEDSIVNLDQAQLGSSSGYYYQVEYIIQKWAPYLGYESFNQWDTESGYKLDAYSIGLNYYAENKSKRYGLVFKNIIQEKNLSGKDSDQAYAYVMLDF